MTSWESKEGKLLGSEILPTAGQEAPGPPHPLKTLRYQGSVLKSLVRQ